MSFRFAVVLSAVCLASTVAVAQTVVSYDSATEVPVSIAIDRAGRAYVSVQPCDVRVYDRFWVESERLTLPGCSGGVVTRGLALNASGTLYVAFGSTQPQSGGVYEVGRSGKWYLLPGTEQIVFPNSIALDGPNGSLFITDMAGAVWKVPVASEDGGPVERHYRPAYKWFESALLTGFDLGLGMPLGANGIVVADGAVIVSVTFPAKLVRIPILENQSAGLAEVLFSSMEVALDDIALDVLGKIYAAVPGGPVVVRISPEPPPAFTPLVSPYITAPTLTLAFGTRKDDRMDVYVGMSQTFGGTGSGIVRLNVGQPGERLP